MRMVSELGFEQIAIPLVLAWFAFRWIYKKAKGALKRGG